MDFLQKFIEIALGRMMGGGTTMGTDNSMSGQGGGSWVSAAQNIPDFFNSITNPDRSTSGTEQAQETGLVIGRSIGDYYTGGNVTPVVKFAEKRWPGTMEKLEGIDRKINPLYHWLGKLYPGKSKEFEGKERLPQHG